MGTIYLYDALNDSANITKTIKSSAAVPFEATDTVWDDLRILPSQFDRPGISDPALIDWRPGGSGTTFQAWAFAASDYAFFTIQMPHTYKQGTDILCHVHWTPQTRGNEESGNTVVWALDYSWANVSGVFGASTTVEMSDTTTGTDHYHQMTSSATITGTGKTVSSMLVCKFWRKGGTWAGTSDAQSPVLLEVDFHYQIDTLGSQAETSK